MPEEQPAQPHQPAPNYPINSAFKSPDELLKDLSPSFEAPIDSNIDTTDAFSDESKYLDNKYKKAQVDKINNDNEARKVYGELIFTVTVIWLLLILMIVFQSGKGLLKLSDSVLITLITTTTASVFGFFLLVVNYLFNKDKST